MSNKGQGIDPISPWGKVQHIFLPRERVNLRLGKNHLWNNALCQKQLCPVPEVCWQSVKIKNWQCLVEVVHRPLSIPETVGEKDWDIIEDRNFVHVVAAMSPTMKSQCPGRRNYQGEGDKCTIIVTVCTMVVTSTCERPEVLFQGSLWASYIPSKVCLEHWRREEVDVYPPSSTPRKLYIWTSTIQHGLVR